MNDAASCPSLHADRPRLLTAALVDQERKLWNAEQVAKFLGDDLTEANAKISVLSDQISEMSAQNREMHRALFKLAELAGVVQDLVRDGRTAIAINLCNDLIEIGKRGRVQP